MASATSVGLVAQSVDEVREVVVRQMEDGQLRQGAGDAAGGLERFREHIRFGVARDSDFGFGERSLADTPSSSETISRSAAPVTSDRTEVCTVQPLLGDGNRNRNERRR